MLTSEQPLPKRKRADGFEDEPAAPVDPVRSDIWYHDGNVVLQAGITQFKVYQGALGEASSVFKDMFSFPQPAAADAELVEGCPVVRVSDSAEELKIVLQAIFQLQYVTGGDKLSLAVVSAFVTLGAKYDIGRLYAAGKRTLYQSFPTTLEELDALTDGKYIEIHDDTSHWMQLAQIARKEGLLSVLPYALYRCIQQYSATTLLGGISTADGTVRRLAPDDLLPCLEGHRRLVKAQANTALAWIYDNDSSSNVCLRPKNCNQLRHKLLKVKFFPEPVVSGLEAWDARHADGLCTPCADISIWYYNAGRETLWEMLPKLLGLPSWSELKKEREKLD